MSTGGRIGAKRAAALVDGNLITSRKPDDLPAFNRAIIDALEEELADEPA